MKFRPMPWRLSHPYVLVDRVEVRHVRTEHCTMLAVEHCTVLPSRSAFVFDYFGGAAVIVRRVIILRGDFRALCAHRAWNPTPAALLRADVQCSSCCLCVTVVMLCLVS